jgi:hypothetical protein
LEIVAAGTATQDIVAKASEKGIAAFGADNDGIACCGAGDLEG